MKKIFEKIGNTFKMILKFLTLRVVVENILGSQKYTKEKKISKGRISILGISKL